jgi:NADH-quinone oxidoreductase subunit L
MVFMAFHGAERFDRSHPPHESPPVVTAPLVLLAIPSVCAGWLIGKVVFTDFIQKPTEEYHGIWAFMAHGVMALPFWLAVAGIATAWFLYIENTHLPKKIAIAFGPLYALVERKYGFDELYSWLFAGGARAVGRGFWKGGDQTLIDGLLVNGSARVTGWFSGVMRLLQSGLVNQYAVSMLIGVVILTYFFMRK